MGVWRPKATMRAAQEGCLNTTQEGVEPSCAYLYDRTNVLESQGGI